MQSNALKFTDVGRVLIKGKIISKTENEEKYLEISVIDTGTGIKDKDKDKLFKMFGYIQDENQQNIHGIGLGLNLSKRLIEQFGGTIEAESVYEEGSTFKFTLKLYNKIDKTV